VGHDRVSTSLEHLDGLTDAERDKIAQEFGALHRHAPDQVDRKTLVVHVSHYLPDFFDGDKTKVLSGHDTRELEGTTDLGSAPLVDRYVRDELGYSTDLTYSGLEDGYMPTPGHPRRSSSEQFYYNQDGMTKADWDRSRKEGEVTYIARDNPTWITNAIRRDKAMQVFVASGRYDPLNMLRRGRAATATLPAELSSPYCQSLL